MSSSSDTNVDRVNCLSKMSELEKMFDLKRIHSFSDLCFLLLYSPIGLFLLVIRIFILLYILLISAILPYNSSFRRSLFFSLGISIDADEDYFKNLRAKFLLSNHISDIDPLILNLLMPCACSSADVSPCFINWLCKMIKQDDEITMKNVPVVCFPEQSKTNGKYGLFQFKFELFQHVSLIHLIFLEARRPFFNVSLSSLGSHWLVDLFWMLFLPITIFKISHLGTLSKQENETHEDFYKRIKQEFEQKTKLKLTNFNLNDKKEFQKRLEQEMKLKNPSSSSSKSTSKPDDSKVEEYSLKIKDILPQVPLNIIKEDIKLTNNIDDTIERILSGKVKYQPETPAPKSSTDCDSGSSIHKNSNENNEKNKNIPRTPSEREALFQERKAQMLRIARIRYYQKYGPIDSS